MKKLVVLLALCFASPALAEEPVTFFPAGNAQNVTYSSSSKASDQIGAYTDVVRMVCSTDCYVAFAVSGQSAVANDSTGIFLPANVPEYMRISKSATVYVVRDTSDGTINILEVTR